jgi:hypothetical protein
MPGLGQGGQRHQEQERDFLDDQAGHHRQRHRIVDDQQVRWAVEPCEPRRDQPHQHARWRNQEGETEGRRRMRYRQKRRYHPPHAGKPGCPEIAGDKRCHRAERHQRGHQSYQDRKSRRTHDARHFAKGGKMCGGEAFAANFGQVAQCRKCGSCQPEGQRTEQDRQCQRRRQSRQAHAASHFSRPRSARSGRQLAAP